MARNEYIDKIAVCGNKEQDVQITKLKTSICNIFHSNIQTFKEHYCLLEKGAILQKWLYTASFFTIDGYSYKIMGLDIPGVLFAINGLGLAGLVVHSWEPVIFTKDRGSKANKG